MSKKSTAVAAAAIALNPRAQFVEDLKLLTEDEHLEILKMLRLKHVPTTENANGVYFPMSIISDELLEELSKFVKFCLESHKRLEARDKEIEKYHVDHDTTIHLPAPVIPPMATALSVDTREADIQRFKRDLEKGNKKGPKRT